MTPMLFTAYDVACWIKAERPEIPEMEAAITKLITERRQHLQATLNEAKVVLNALVDALPEAVRTVMEQGAAFPQSIALAVEDARVVLAKVEQP